MCASPGLGLAFGLRAEDRFAVVSSARMRPAIGEFERPFFVGLVRKMVTRDIGPLYFGLALNDDPSSVLYRQHGGLRDLVTMGEES